MLVSCADWLDGETVVNKVQQHRDRMDAFKSLSVFSMNGEESLSSTVQLSLSLVLDEEDLVTNSTQFNLKKSIEEFNAIIDADMKSYQEEEEGVQQTSNNQSLNFGFHTLLSSLFYDCQEEGEGDIKYGWMPFDGDFQFASMKKQSKKSLQ